jgi:hypothetical protein
MEAFFNRLQKVGVAFMVGGFALTRFIFVVDGGERALKYDKLRGVQPHIYGEGMHFYIPIIQVNQFLQVNLLLSIGTQDLRNQN